LEDISDNEYRGLMTSHVMVNESSLDLKNCSLQDELDQVLTSQLYKFVVFSLTF
jgi:hypothetical protein